MNSKKNKILVLNKSYFPLRVENMQQTFVNMAKGTYLGIDFEYDVDENGNLKFDEISSLIAVKSLEDWMKLEVRPYDEYINTIHGPVRIPPVVVCSTFNRIKFPKVLFPTNRNIFKRDEYTCCYTGKKLQKTELSVDHILPKSKGGKDTWENLVTCDKMINCRKADKTPEEAGLKLLIKPTRPKNGLVFEVVRDEWKVFVDSLK
jgi:hypothetical protein